MTTNGCEIADECFTTISIVYIVIVRRSYCHVGILWENDESSTALFFRRCYKQQNETLFRIRCSTSEVFCYSANNKRCSEGESGALWLWSQSVDRETSKKKNMFCLLVNAYQTVISVCFHFESTWHFWHSSTDNILFHHESFLWLMSVTSHRSTTMSRIVERAGTIRVLLQWPIIPTEFIFTQLGANASIYAMHPLFFLPKHTIPTIRQWFGDRSQKQET